MRVVATAGHVDHGKSTLVRALTGMEPDRWAEERRRGMTIDLGYAWTTLPSGTVMAFVDVPGHQRFIANMLAGLGPAPGVLFVVAADAGWSRQSEDHLRAIQALAVQNAVLAVTRSDLADPAPVLVDASRRLADAGVEAGAVAVSGRDGTGLDDLRTALDGLARALPFPDENADVRLWIDRAFTVRGSGTVVTGTLAAGAVHTGQTFELGGREATVRDVRVRGLQSLGENADRVVAPARVALNLRDVATDDVSRGDVLLTAGAWRHADTVDVATTPTTPPTTPPTTELATHLVLHVGTAAVPVRVRPLGPGLARLALDRPLPLRVGDRGVLRDPGLQVIAAGVRVLDADPPPLRRRGDAARRAGVLADGPPTATAEVERRGAVRRTQLVRLGHPDGTPDGAREIGDWLVSDTRWRKWVAAVAPAAEQWASRDPLQPGMPVAALVRELDLPHADLMAAVLADAGVTATDGRLDPPRRVSDLGPAEAGLAQVAQRLADRPFAAPDADDLRAWRLGRRELAAAERAGRILRLPGDTGDVVLLPDSVERAREILSGLGATFTTAQARQALGTTRRVAIPLLEHLDRIGVTERLDPGTRRIVPRPG